MLTEKLKGDYGTSCRNKADRLRQELDRYIATYTAEPATQPAIREADRIARMQEAEATAAQIDRWLARAKVAEQRGLFLITPDDATDGEFLTDESIRQLRAECLKAGLSTNHM
jgi:hypothetical protein